VLVDAYKKGFKVDFSLIIDSLIAENKRLDFSRPDKALESAYDTWALAEVFLIMGNREAYNTYLAKALQYKQAWLKDFKDLDKKDVDQMSARKMYQGTIRQYRWSVPFDVKGLIELCGGKTAFGNQLDDFFDNDNFNRTNEPDLMAHNLYNASATPFKAQYLVHKFAVDTVINHYFNDNSKGIGAEITTVYNNRPAAFLRTMDDDAGAMSSWFIFAALGLQPANIGHPIYYLHAPLFESIELKPDANHRLQILVKNFNKSHCYVNSVILNGKQLDRNWISHEELVAGGKLVFVTSASPNKEWGLKNQWIADAGSK
jgi:putative alpha-1,2-mannosidase